MIPTPVGYTALGVPVLRWEHYDVREQALVRAYRAGRAYTMVVAPDETVDAKMIQAISLYEVMSGS